MREPEPKVYILERHLVNGDPVKKSMTGEVATAEELLYEYRDLKTIGNVGNKLQCSSNNKQTNENHNLRLP